MISVQQFQDIFARSLFGGDLTIAGIVMYAAVLGVVFVLCKNNISTGVLLSLPVTLVFSLMGVLSPELTMLMIVIAVLALAMMAKRTFGD